MQKYTTSIKKVKNGTRWTVRKGHESLIDEINTDDFRSSLNGKPYKLIKETKVRSVVSIPGPGKDEDGVYIKIFKKKDYRDSIKHFFLPANIRTEWKVANELISKDINTALPLAMAEKVSWRLPVNSLIVTRAISNSAPLMEFCRSYFNGPLSEQKLAEKKSLLIDLAIFIRDIHEKGFFHTDLHAGNILIKFESNLSRPDRGYSLYLMDLHHVKILKNLSKRKRLYNFAQIFNSLSSILTKPDKLDLVNAYNFPHDIAQSLVEQIESKSTGIRNVHYKSRLKRCLKESSNFSRTRIGRFRIFYRKGHDTNSFPELIKKHHNALADNDKDAIIKYDSKTALTGFPFKSKEIRSVVVKQYKTACGACLLKNIFRNSAGRRLWIAGNGLIAYGHKSATPLALIEKKGPGIVTDSYLVMEDVTDCLEMDRYILKNFRNQSEKKRAFIKTFAKNIADMHNQKVYHSDMKTCNIMVKEDENNSTGFIFLDFDNVSFGKSISLHQRIKNLTQINLSTPKHINIKDRFMFLKEYLEQTNLMDERKNILREIINKSKTEQILYVSPEGEVTEHW